MTSGDVAVMLPLAAPAAIEKKCGIHEGT